MDVKCTDPVITAKVSVTGMSCQEVDAYQLKSL